MEQLFTTIFQAELFITNRVSLLNVITMKKNKLIKLISLSAALLLVLWFIFNGKFFKEEEQADPLRSPSAASAILPVKAMIIKKAPLTDKLIAGGSIMADEQVNVSSEIAGQVVKIHFREGSTVEEGTLLVTINNADLYAQIARNKHQLKLARESEARQKQLLEKQGISQQTYDQVLTELSTLEAEASLLEAQLEKTLIRAPFSGRLGLRQISEGSFLSPGMPIVSLVRMQPVKVEFSVPERYAPYISIGNEVSFTVENQAGNFLATIYAIEPRIDARTRSLPVRALYPNSDQKIIPGSFARVTIPLLSKNETMQVKAEALIPEMGTHKVYVYRNGLAEPVQVRTGLRTESAVEIVEGLTPGDTVLTTGLLQLRPGMEVQITGIE